MLQPWLGLKPVWLGLKPGWLGLKPGWLGLRPGWLGLRPGWLAQRGDEWTYRHTDVQMYGCTDVRKISPFYRTLCPIGAAALPPPMKTKEKVEQGKGTADHLMPLGNFIIVKQTDSKSNLFSSEPRIFE